MGPQPQLALVSDAVFLRNLQLVSGGEDHRHPKVCRALSLNTRVRQARSLVPGYHGQAKIPVLQISIKRTLMICAVV